jgi:hypothetical protein
VILQDIGPDGRLLLCRDTARSYIFVRRSGDAADRDVSWFDQGLASDLSPDGKILAFTEQSEEAGPSYAACIRDLSGNAPVRLGSGNCAGLSPDGRYVLAEDPDTAVITALPTGAGEPHRIPTPPDLHRQGPARWLPAGSGIVIFGRQNNRTVGYVIDFPSGATRAIAAAAPMQQPGEAVPTLDGRAAVVTDYTTGNLLFVPFDAAQPRPVPGAKPGGCEDVVRPLRQDVSRGRRPPRRDDRSAPAVENARSRRSRRPDHHVRHGHQPRRFDVRIRQLPGADRSLPRRWFEVTA